MKRWQKLLVLISAPIAFFVLFTGRVHAAYQSDNLIDDHIFVNSGTMGASAIQSFLNSKGGGIRNYSEGGKSAAQIIYEAAQAYGLNPQVILATLQKEQSLVTDPSPDQAQFNCAMGYKSCASHNSFFSQVDAGTWQLRYNLEASSGRDWGGRSASLYPCKNGRDTDPDNNFYSTGLFPGRTVTFYNTGGVAKTITLANAATASLYCYTPHVGPYSETGYSGSYNFVVSFEAWFGPPTGEGYTLATSKADNGDDRQWVIYKGIRRHVPNTDLLIAWGVR